METNELKKEAKLIIDILPIKKLKAFLSLIEFDKPIIAVSKRGNKYELEKGDFENMAYLGMSDINRYADVIDNSKQADKDWQEGNYEIVDIDKWRDEILGNKKKVA
jgi:hypothetical protein